MCALSYLFLYAKHLAAFMRGEVMRFDWPGVVQIGVFMALLDGQTIKLVERRKALFLATEMGEDVFINGLRALGGLRGLCGARSRIL